MMLRASMSWLKLKTAAWRAENADRGDRFQQA
jgi:hypothetical protein